MPFSEIRSAAIISTLKTLHLRVEERFPESSLNLVCKEVVEIARKADARSADYRRPYYLLRGLWTGAFVIAMIVTTILGVWLTHEFTDTNAQGRRFFAPAMALHYLRGWNLQ